jgi:hypothetical protein
MATKDFRGREIIVEIGDAGDAAKKKNRRTALFGGEPDDPLSRRRRSRVCSWVRSWPYEFEHYRAWTAFTNDGPRYYNGTKFSNQVRTGIQWFDETIGINKGIYGYSTRAPIFFEPFDPNAFPENGPVAINANKNTGLITVSTPNVSYSGTMQALSDFPALAWTGGIQFRNFYVEYNLRKPVAGGTSTVVLSADAGPDWVRYFNFDFTIRRTGNEFDIEGITLIDPFGQTFDYYDGTYTPPIPSPCNTATANAQAEAARQSFEEELNGFHYIVCGEM